LTFFRNFSNVFGMQMIGGGVIGGIAGKGDEPLSTTAVKRIQSDYKGNPRRESFLGVFFFPLSFLLLLAPSSPPLQRSRGYAPWERAIDIWGRCWLSVIFLFFFLLGFVFALNRERKKVSS